MKRQTTKILQFIVILISFLTITSNPTLASTPSEETTNQEPSAEPFRARLYNKEYKVGLNIDLYDQAITVPGQEIFGEMAGFLKSDNNTYCWLITDAKIKNDGKTAELSFTNDYGSEDFEARLTINKDGMYVLEYLGGSTFKIPNGKKWVKLPKIMKFEKRK